MGAGTRRFVRRRADDRCEYCRIHQRDTGILHHIEHIVAKQHSGMDSDDNLALACQRCNLQKGPNLTAIDPPTGALTLLFHPRRDLWPDHFSVYGPLIQGLTAVGRATAQLLAMNDARRVELRRILRELGELP